MCTPKFMSIWMFRINLFAKYLKTIEQQSQVRFFYSDDLMSMDQLIDVKADNESILNVLDDVFSKSQLTYKAYENNLIVIAPRELLQQNKITGTIVDKNGAPIVGANIVVTGTTHGTITDINGKYSLEVPAGSKSLTFSFIGMDIAGNHYRDIHPDQCNFGPVGNWTR